MAQTTIMRDSIVGDAWIQQTAQSVPVQRIYDQKTGQPTGDILTGPVRLSFVNLFKLPAANDKNNNPKYGAAVMFSPLADFTIFYEEYYRVCAAEFASHYDAGSNQYVGLHSPFRRQDEKLNFGGFTPGLTWFTATSKFKPPVVDARFNPVVDESKAYAGVWAICAVNPYAYKDPRKKGVGFGLQSVMLIGDDTPFGGGPKNPTDTFAKVNVSAPIVPPDIARNMPAGQNMPGMPGMPATPRPPIPQQMYTPAAPVPPAPTASSEDDEIRALLG